MLVVRKAVAKTTSQVDELDGVIWALGRAYFAYVGALERVLMERKLDHVLRPGMGLVLFTLFEEDSRTIKEVAERSQLACSTLTGVLQRMEKAGLIQRTRDPEDGRSVRVTLTPLARQLEQECKQVAKRMAKLSEQGIGEQNVGQCKTFLSGMTAVFRAEEQRLAEIQGAQAKSGQA